ncbi:hypothetical protein BAXH7_03107 [Bacillus amyloliquefaciens XH7]|nr:hypothetical protein BAXH7_03107 [Bacillus amyloliquefaciens XH7]KYC99511.1 hypothetical protein B425_3998 [Bacillus amyloliquefaciens]
MRAGRKKTAQKKDRLTSDGLVPVRFRNYLQLQGCVGGVLRF